MKKYVMDCRREVAFTSKRVGDIYRARVLGNADVRVTFATKLAYALEVYEAARRKGRVDFEYYKNADASEFGVDEATLDCPDIRYRTSFNASESLVARLDSVKQEIQEFLLGQGKVNRNFAVAILFRIVVDYDRDSVHYCV